MEKKSFLIYFDAAPMVNDLSPEQRGWLLTALLDYGARVGEQEGIDPKLVMGSYPLEPQTEMAFSFMAGYITRDTERWWKLRQSREARREMGGQSPKTEQPSKPSHPPRRPNPTPRSPLERDRIARGLPPELSREEAREAMARLQEGIAQRKGFAGLLNLGSPPAPEDPS